MELARSLVDRGEMDAALRHLDRAAALDPDKALVYDCRALVHAHLNNLEQAVADADHSLQLNPKGADAYFNRGLANAVMGLDNLAEADFTAAIESAPWAALAHADRGILRASEGRHEEAIADYEQALRVEPSLAELHQLRAESEEAEGQPTGARTEAEVPSSVSRRTPDGVRTLIARAFISREADAYDRDIYEYSAVLDASPGDVEARTMRWLSYANRGTDPGLAIADLDVVLSDITDPQARKAYYRHRARLNETANDFEAAIADLDAAIILAGTLDPDPEFNDDTIVLRRACLLVLMGRCEQAVQSLPPELDDRNADMRYLRAAAHVGCGNAAAARADIDRATEIDAGIWSAAAEWGPSTALAALLNGRNLLTGRSTQAEVAEWWVNTYARPGTTIPSSYRLRTASGGDGPASPGAPGDAPETVDALVYRVAVYLLLGEQEERALSLLDQAALLEPDNVAVLMTRMRLNADLHRYDQSLSDAEAIIALRPHTAAVYVERASVRKRRGDALDAILVDLDRAVELSPGDATVRRAHDLMLEVRPLGPVTTSRANW